MVCLKIILTYHLYVTVKTIFKLTQTQTLRNMLSNAHGPWNWLRIWQNVFEINPLFATRLFYLLTAVHSTRLWSLHKENTSINKFLHNIQYDWYISLCGLQNIFTSHSSDLNWQTVYKTNMKFYILERHICETLEVSLNDHQILRFMRVPPKCSLCFHSKASNCSFMRHWVRWPEQKALVYLMSRELIKYGLLF